MLLGVHWLAVLLSAAALILVVRVVRVLAALGALVRVLAALGALCSVTVCPIHLASRSQATRGPFRPADGSPSSMSGRGS